MNSETSGQRVMLLVMHAVAIITPITLSAPRPAPQSTGIPLWQIIVALGVILGILVALGNFVDWGSRLRNRRADKRMRELVNAQLKAEDIEGRLDKLTQLSDTLQKQIDAVPDEANRLFLNRRIEYLAASIARDFEEYRTTERELQRPDLSPVLDPTIRDVIQRTILPGQRTRERRNVYVLALLLALVVLNLSPINVSSLIYQYFSILGNSANWTVATIAASVSISTLVVTVILMFASELYPPLKKEFDKQRRLVWFIIPVILVVAAITLGFWWRAYVASQECFPYACSPFTASGQNDASAIAFNIAPIIAGIWLVSMLRIAIRTQGNRAIR
jgi:hypothetical protein